MVHMYIILCFLPFQNGFVLKYNSELVVNCRWLITNLLYRVFNMPVWWNVHVLYIFLSFSHLFCITGRIVKWTVVLWKLRQRKTGYWIHLFSHRRGKYVWISDSQPFLLKSLHLSNTIWRLRYFLYFCCNWHTFSNFYLVFFFFF